MGRYTSFLDGSRGVFLTGKSEALERLNVEVLNIKNRSIEGMRLAGLLVRRAATPLTPVQSGNLRGSQYSESYGSGNEVGVEIGYTAAYAPYVHEIDKHYVSPGTGWKFLEKALTNNQKEIIETIRKSAMVEGGVFSKSVGQLKQEAALSAGYFGYGGEGI